MNFHDAENYIIHRLKKELSSTMYYHNVEHTLDVQKVVKELVIKENIDPQQGLIVETAALYHDSGMMITYKDHELASVDIVGKVLPDYAYSPSEIEAVCELIMATSLPQRPETFTGKILCDADMDNLGRNDFLIQSFKLKLELEMNGIATSTLKKWLENLVRFLEEHIYYTATAIKVRQAKKNQNLNELKEIVMLF